MIDLMWLFPPQPTVIGVEWQWPMALYRGPYKRHAAYVIHDGPYRSEYANYGGHKPLAVVILRYDRIKLDSPDSYGNRMLCDARFNSLRSLIEFTEHFIKITPEWHPRII